MRQLGDGRSPVGWDCAVVRSRLVVVELSDSESGWLRLAGWQQQTTIWQLGNWAI